MENIRRSERTRKPKRNTVISTVRESRKTPNSRNGKNVDKFITGADENVNRTNTSSQDIAIGSVCEKKKLRKTRTLGTFVIDCNDITGEHQIDLDAFKTYLQSKIKVGGKRNDKRVKVGKEDMKILIEADVFIEKKSIKYFIKLFLKSNELHNWIRIVNGKKMYLLKYFRNDNSQME